MRNNLFVFGCSFSSPHKDIIEQDLYGTKLAKSIDYDLQLRGQEGVCNDWLHKELCKSLSEIKENDIIIFQFTGFTRIGFYEKWNDMTTYFTTAGFSHLNQKESHPTKNFSKKTNRELQTLLDYVAFWQEKRYSFLYKPTIDILEYLKKEKGVQYVIMYMNSDCIYITDETLILPTHTDKKNTSMVRFLQSSKLTISDYGAEKYGKEDYHPSIYGHKKLSDIIQNTLKITSKNLI